MQQHRPLIIPIAYLHSYNLNIFINSSYENIVLDDAPIAGLTNFSVTVSNNSSSGNISNIIVYGSADGIKYYLFNDNIFNGNIAANSTAHVEFSLLTLFMRITCQADADINIDIHLQGNIV